MIKQEKKEQIGKLKTLKEIESFNELNPRFVNSGTLKKEAIK